MKKTTIAAFLLCMATMSHAQNNDIVRIFTPSKTYAFLTTDVDSITFGGICPDNNHPHAIDMGLSTKWACCSVGAEAPEEEGIYYAWGETHTKDYFWYDEYEFYDEENEECTLRIDISGTKYDAAFTNWNDNWVMPTKAAAEELLQNCTWTLTKYHNVNGFIVTAPNGQCLFFPLSGGYALTQKIDYDKLGYYWLSTPAENGMAYVLQFNSRNKYANIEPTYPQIGLLVRPVKRTFRQ